MRVQTKGSMYIFTADNHDDLARRYCGAVWRRRLERGRSEPGEAPWTEWPLRRWLRKEAKGYRFHNNVEIRVDSAEHFFEDLVANDLARYVPEGYLCLRTPDEEYVAAADYEDAARQLQNVRFNFHPEQSVEDWMREYAARIAECGKPKLAPLNGKTPRSDTARNFIEDLIAIGELERLPDA